MSCVTGLIIVIFFILIIMIIGSSCAYKQELECFGNDIYKEWSQKLEEMKLHSEIGSPPGILKLNKDSPECNTEQNIMIQSNVAFRPTRSGEKGCTYIEKVWPAE